MTVHRKIFTGLHPGKVNVFGCCMLKHKSVTEMFLGPKIIIQLYLPVVLMVFFSLQVNSDAELNIQENTEYIKDSPLPYIPVNLSTDVPASPSPDVTTPSLDSVQFVAPRHSTGKRVKRTHQRIDKSLETLESIKDQLLNNKVEDEFYYFGENVASQLRHLPVLDALGVQCEILKLIAMKRRSTNNLNLPVSDNHTVLFNNILTEETNIQT